MRSLCKALVALAAILTAGSADAQTIPDAPIPYVQTRPTPKAASPPGKPVPAAAPAPRPALPGARLAAGQAIDPTELEAFVDGWMGEAMRRDHIAGATVAIVQNGQVTLKKGYGFSDLARRRPVDPDRTLFRLGGVSKTLTWILLMRQVEARRISLARPVNLYLPEKVRLPGRGREVTVASLLDHTSGFEDRALGQLIEDDPRRVRPLDLYLRQERPGPAPAGRTASVSNYGAALAGEVVAFVSGKTFERTAEDEIFAPLGMTRTTFREPRPERRGLPAAMPRALRADLATGYGWRDAGFVATPYEFMGQVAPAASASSTGADMSRYMLMLLNDGAGGGAAIFGPQTARAFRTPMLRTPPGVNGWAHGFTAVNLPGGVRGYGHVGCLGHAVAFKSNLVVAPDLGLGIFIATNSEAGESLVEVMPAALVRRFYGPPAAYPRPGSSELAAAAHDFEGAYLTTRRAEGGLEGFVGLLAGGVDVRVTRDGRLLTRAGASQAWTLDGPMSRGLLVAVNGDDRMAFRTHDGRTTFQPAANTESLQRASFWERRSTLAALAGLTALASAITLVGLMLRDRRELRQNPAQVRAALVQNMQAGLWLVALGLFAAWALHAADPKQVMFGWPGPLVILASASALVAATLTLVTVAALPAVWQGGRRVDSWSPMRKILFTGTVLIYAAFSAALAMNGALEPWSR